MVFNNTRIGEKKVKRNNKKTTKEMEYLIIFKNTITKQEKKVELLVD